MLPRTHAGTVTAAALITSAAWYLRTRRLTTSRRHLPADDDTARWRHLATHDALTGLPNRLALLDELNRRATRGRFLAVLLDVDGLKPINDMLGHAAGDQVLITIAHRLATAVAPCGFAARLGGDEFVALLPIPSTEDGTDRLLSELHSTLGEPLRLPGRNRAISVWSSLGAVAVTRPGLSTDLILGCADAAMYRAKRADLGADLYVEAIHGALSDIAARVAGRPAVRLRDQAIRPSQRVNRPIREAA